MKASTKGLIEKLNFKKYPSKLILNKPEYINDFDAVEYGDSIAKEQ